MPNGTYGVIQVPLKKILYVNVVAASKFTLSIVDVSGLKIIASKIIISKNVHVKDIYKNIKYKLSLKTNHKQVILSLHKM